MKYILALIIGCLQFSNVAQADHESVCKAIMQYEELIDVAKEQRGETVVETVVLNDNLVVSISKAKEKDNWTIALVSSDGIACILSFSKMETSEES